MIMLKNKGVLKKKIHEIYFLNSIYLNIKIYLKRIFSKKLDFFVVYHDVNSCKESVVL